MLVEDDPSYSLEIQMLIDELGYELQGIADNANDVFGILKKGKPDLILMDIQLKGEMTGIEIAKRLDKEKIPIIFITSFDDRETFGEAKQTNNYGYIVKPFNNLTLESTIEVALIKSGKEGNQQSLEEDETWNEDLILEDFVFIKKRNRLEKVALNDIFFLEADGNYCKISTSTKRFILKMSLKRANEILSSKNFVRISKGHIVNMKCVTTIELSKNMIVLNTEAFPIGKRYKSNVMKRLKLMT